MRVRKHVTENFMKWALMIGNEGRELGLHVILGKYYG